MIGEGTDGLLRGALDAARVARVCTKELTFGNYRPYTTFVALVALRS
jgi:hypothetical protein